MNLGNEILLTVYQRQYKFSVQLCSQLWHMITYQALEIFGQVQNNDKITLMTEF